MPVMGLAPPAAIAPPAVAPLHRTRFRREDGGGYTVRCFVCGIVAETATVDGATTVAINHETARSR